MEAKHFFGKVALKAVLPRENTVLITRDDLGNWEIPGGRLNEGEESEDALKREFREELGVAVDVVRLIYTEQYLQTRDGSPHLLLAYEVKLVDGNAPLKPSESEVLETKWIRKDEIDQYVIYSNCLNAINAYFEIL